MHNHSFIKELVLQFCSEQENPAFSLYDGSRLTQVSYPEFARDILKAAGYLASNNIRNQHISLVAPNSYEWVVAFFGILASGNVAVMMNQDLPADLLQWQMEKADVTWFCSDEAYTPNLCAQLNGVQGVSFADLLTGTPMAAEDVYSSGAEETMSMLFTSGTTGNSKAVELTAENWRYSAVSFDTMYNAPDRTRISIPVPFYHALGLENLVEVLRCGKTVCLGRGVKYLFLDLGALNPQLMIAVPAIAESLVKVLKMAAGEKERRKFIGDSLQEICFAGAALKEPTMRFLLQSGFRMSVNYGMSEIPGAATWSVICQERHYTTAGRFTDHTQYRFVEGELLLKSPTLMKQYYKDPEETAKVLEDGWIHTGDLGYCDEDGYFYLTGRKKNVIILSNGENVNPEEVERQLSLCDAIVECMVYGDGRGICADIFTDNAGEVERFVKAYNKTMPMYRHVYKVNCLSEPLEKTGSGKIKRKVNSNG